MTPDQIQDLSTKAARVAEQSAELAAAVSAEREARALVLQAVIDTARPALRALSSRIKILDSDTGLGTDKARSRIEYHVERGLYLDPDTTTGPSKDAPRDDSGAYEGVDYFLLTTGAVLRLKYEGSWSKWQGASDTWEANESLLPEAEGIAKLVALNLDGDAIAAISKALDAQLAGDAPKRAKAALERAEKLRAVVALTRKS